MDDLSDLTLYLEKANRAALSQDWQDLACQTLELLQEICQSDAALVFQAGQLAPRSACSGCPAGMTAAQWEAARPALLRPELFQENHPRWIERESFDLAALPLPPALHNLLILPFSAPSLTHTTAPGGFLLVNSGRPRADLAAWIASRMASELDKAAVIEASRHREAKLRELNNILGQLSGSLDANQVLRMFIKQAQQFLQVEAVSVFLIDEESGDLVLKVAGQENTEYEVEEIRVPAGKGIIGYVTQTGKTVLVPDVRNDPRHYNQVDQESGFTTRSILAVPLHTWPINLGQERGTSSERIIGGLEALNKIGGPFQQEDPELLQILAKGAATIHMVARLYEEAHNLFEEVTQAIVEAIDAKDPYTKGHSQRVSQYSVEVARELGLSAEEVYQVKIGSLFHDVGKIGIPDQILGKNSKLDNDELKTMHKHPTIGGAILGKVHQMKNEIPAMIGHHEWLDGSGYPEGLQGDQIPLISRIVAVADVFDALTSDRPYRSAMPLDKVFEILKRDSGTHLDGACVQALVRAYNKGAIHTQDEQRQDDE